MRFTLFILFLTKIYAYPFINLLRKYPIESLTPVHNINCKTPKILDIGCGYGQSTQQIHNLVKKDSIITGIDKDEFKILKANHQHRLLKFGIDDIRYSKLPSNEYDMLFVSNVFQEIENKDFEKVVKQMNRISKNENSILYLYHNHITDQLSDNMKIFYKNFNIIQSSIQENNHYIIAKPRKV